MVPRMQEAEYQHSLGGVAGAMPVNCRRPQDVARGRKGARYVFGESVTHQRLPTETNKSPAAVGLQGMIASPYEQGQQNQLLVRRPAFRNICRSDLLSGSTVASVVRSEIVGPCEFYAATANCQL